MKVCIAGSRLITDMELVFKCIGRSKMDITEVVSGGAKGVDLLGEAYAIKHFLPIVPFWADWQKYGKCAGPIRNRQMAEYCNAAIIVWDGESSGTRNMIECMKSLGKPYILWDARGDRLEQHSGLY